MSLCKRCCICGMVITERFHVCLACEEEWGLSGPLKTWPEWVQALKRDGARGLYRMRRDTAHEQSYIDGWAGPVSLSQAEEEAEELGLDCVDAHGYMARRAWLEP